MNFRSSYTCLNGAASWALARLTSQVSGGRWHGAYDYLVEMDADFSHNPDDLIRLYNAPVPIGTPDCPPRRRGRGVALHQGRERGELAHWAGADVLRGGGLRSVHHGYAHHGPYGRALSVTAPTC